MKLQAPYFGNRFATVAKKKAVKAKPVSEMEALEPRMLLSGITAGGKVYKSYNFIDADGDKVSIKLTGKVAKGAGFQVDALGNGFDVNEINLVGDLSKANLVVSVKPVKLAPSDRTTANQLFSSGYTSVGSITADSQATSNGTATGATAIRNIGLNAAVVGDISLVNTDITGAISLGLGKTQFVDRINTASPTTGGAASSYVPSSGYIDLYDITANSIGKIVINGAGTNDTDGVFPPGYSPSNDFLGSITVTNDLGGITGVRSNLNSDVIVGGDMGLINVGGFNGTLDVGGDLAIRLPYNATGTITAGGHVHLGWGSDPTGGGAVSNASITAGAGISGLKTTGTTALTDTIFVPAAYAGTLTNTSTASTAGSGVANISITGGAATGFTIVSGNSVGSITGTEFTGMSVTSGVGGIGNLTATAGDIGGNFNSAGNIGAIKSTGGTIGGTFTAVGNITSIAATAETGTAVGGTYTAGGSIGPINANITTAAGGSAINATITAGTTIGNITAISVSTTGSNVVAGSITATDGIGAIDITAANSGSALAATINASKNNINPAGSTTILDGGITSIEINSSGTGQGITSSTIDASFIGSIEVNMTNTSAGNAINGTTFTASAKTETGIGLNQYNDFGYIGAITVTNNSTGAGGGIIGNAVFNAGGSAGGATVSRLSIGNVDVTVRGTSAAIDANFNGASGSQDTIKNSAIGTVEVLHTGTGTGIDSSSFTANDGVGAISVESQSTGISGITVQADADGDATGAVGNISVEITGAAAPFGINGTTVQGASVSNIEVLFPNSASFGSTTGTGINSLGVTATAGNIGTITVGASANRAGAIGINAGSLTATGNIDAITVFSNTGDAINGLNVTADSDGDGAGNLVSISANSAGASAIEGGTYKGANIGSITANVTGGSDSAIKGVTFTAYDKVATATANEFQNEGTIGTILVSNTGTGGGITDNTAFNAGKAAGASAIGASTITVTGATAWAIDNVTFDAKQPLVGLVLPQFESSAATSVVGQIKTIGGQGINNLTVNASASVAGIDTDGTFDQSITVNAPSVGALVVDNLDNLKTVTYTVGASVTSLGQITVRDNPVTADVGNLILSGAPTALASVIGIDVDGAANISGLANLATDASVGAIKVDGAFTVGTVLSTAKNLTSLNVGSFAAATSIGNGVVGSTVGLVTVGNNTTTPFAIDLFFKSFNGAIAAAPGTQIGSVGTPVTNVFAVASTFLGGGQTVNTVTFRAV
jgi:hypothetical protein